MTTLNEVRQLRTGRDAAAGRGAEVQEWQRRYVRRVLVTDLAAALVACGAAWVIRFYETLATTPEYALLSGVLPLAWLATVSFARAYESRFLGTGPEEFRRIVSAGGALTVIVAVVSYATKAEVARGYVLLALPLAVLLTLAGRRAARRWLFAQRRAGRCQHRVLLVGHETAVAQWAMQLQWEEYAGMRVVGACLPTADQRAALLDYQVPVLGDFTDVPEAVAASGADTAAVLACPEMDGTALRRLAWRLENTGTDLLVAPAAMDVAGPRIHLRLVSGMPLLHVEQPELSGGRRALKAVADRCTAGAALLVLAPVLLVLALLVRGTSEGPVLFRQRRVGLGGHEFTMLKFRTMVEDADALKQRLARENESDGGVLFKMRRDPRVTRVGAFLRRYSLDELPQLLNVVTGSMSLVGPRPPLSSEVEMYDEDMRARRMLVKPGLTGLWQISGRSDLSWDESVRLDLRYVENWSLALDFSILVRTASAVVRGAGAY